MRTLKIGVIGTGNMGRNHVRNLVAEKRFDLVGFYDADASQAAETLERYGTKAFENIDDLLNEVDAVVIAVPSSHHKDIALKTAWGGGFTH